MIRIGRKLGVVFLATALLACSPAYVETERFDEAPAPDEVSVPDSELGLAKGSVFDVADPDPVRSNPLDPGEGARFPRAFVEGPPQSSHSLAGMLPITREENLCIDCHLIEGAEEGDPTPIPESHLVDLRNAPDVIREDVAGARYVCVTCHVRKTEAQPLVGVVGGAPTD